MYTRKYKELLKPEVRISRGEVLPRNIYRISTYRGSKPITKTGDDSRYVFVIGKVDNKIHCVRLNEINPLDFTKFINKMRDKRKQIKKNQKLSELLVLTKREGSDLFERFVKPNPKIYRANTKSSYRIYKLPDIVNIWEIRFEDNFLRKLFGEKDDPMTVPEMKEVITEETNERDG